MIASSTSAPSHADATQTVQADAFLGVVQSCAGRRWRLRPAQDRHAAAISQRLGLPDVIGRVLAARGVAIEDADGFLNPTLRTALPDPSHLLDMDKAVDRLVTAIEAGEGIAIFGDYDVDGATSTALLCRFFRALGIDPLLHIPDRRLEGYGPNGPALRSLAEAGAKVVVTVDCGTAAHRALAEGQEVGLDCIVCDHHEADPTLPPAIAVINPKRIDETSPHTHLAAVGVAFLLAVAVNRRLRQRDYFQKANRPEPDLMALLDLVALGTVCDMVPLVGVNRALVTQGLKVMRRSWVPKASSGVSGSRPSGGNIGLGALISSAGLNDAPTAFHLGYMLGPRVNAGGRVGRAGLGAELLSCDDPTQADRMAAELEAFNGARKDIEAAVLAEAMEQVEAAPPTAYPLVFACGQDWHAGVIGIVAGRLKERYSLPACAVALEGGLAKGSGRSVPGIDLGRAVIAAREAGLLEAGGGHAMACGFTVREDRLEEFQTFLGERIAAQAAGEDTPDDVLMPTLELDGLVDPLGATVELVEALEQAGPFGSGNPDPRFALADVRIAKADVVGMGHIRAFLSGPDGGRLKAMAFKAADEEMGLALLAARREDRLHVAGTLRVDRWGGREEALLVIDDVARIPA
ncbi:MAG: single-stranded-DNA-specific exonuclease RecJ [Rhodospirillaceae bacterium]